jgi:Flp pilus assembly protein TadB
MNSGTLVASLIFAAVLVIVIAVVIQLMMRGWRRRSQRQEKLIGDLPAVPAEVGAADITTRGVYCGCTMAPEWNERITAGDLGYRSKAALTRYSE